MTGHDSRCTPDVYSRLIVIESHIHIQILTLIKITIQTQAQAPNHLFLVRQRSQFWQEYDMFQCFRFSHAFKVEVKVESCSFYNS